MRRKAGFESFDPGLLDRGARGRSLVESPCRTAPPRCTVGALPLRLRAAALVRVLTNLPGLDARKIWVR